MKSAPSTSPLAMDSQRFFCGSGISATCKGWVGVQNRAHVRRPAPGSPHHHPRPAWLERQLLTLGPAFASSVATPTSAVQIRTASGLQMDTVDKANTKKGWGERQGKALLPGSVFICELRGGYVGVICFIYL